MKTGKACMLLKKQGLLLEGYTGVLSLARIMIHLFRTKGLSSKSFSWVTCTIWKTAKSHFTTVREQNYDLFPNIWVAGSGNAKRNIYWDGIV